MMIEASSVKKPVKGGRNTIKVDLSYGEFIDKVTILRIKSERITDPFKRRNVATELESLVSLFEKHISRSQELQRFMDELLEVNKRLWNIEDAIREKERSKAFDQEFIALARDVYHTNDHRARLKRKIDELLGSYILEEKSYADF